MLTKVIVKKVVLILVLITTSGVLIRGETAYFLLQPKDGSAPDSFLLPLTNATAIAEARRQLAELPLQQRESAGCRIARGADQLNRNYLSPGAPKWSWHVVEFTGFFDAAPPENQGTPTGVEEDLDYWVDEQQGLLLFVSYAIGAEIKPAPFVIMVESVVGALRLSWPGFGTNYVYTVEESDAIENPSWKPLNGKSWPIAQTNFEFVPSLNGSSEAQFFRLRAAAVAEDLIQSTAR